MCISHHHLVIVKLAVRGIYIRGAENDRVFLGWNWGMMMILRCRYGVVSYEIIENNEVMKSERSCIFVF